MVFERQILTYPQYDTSFPIGDIINECNANKPKDQTEIERIGYFVNDASEEDLDYSRCVRGFPLLDENGEPIIVSHHSGKTWHKTTDALYFNEDDLIVLFPGKVDIARDRTRSSRSFVFLTKEGTNANLEELENILAEACFKHWHRQLPQYIGREIRIKNFKDL